MLAVQLDQAWPMYKAGGAAQGGLRSAPGCESPWDGLGVPALRTRDLACTDQTASWDTMLCPQQCGGRTLWRTSNMPASDIVFSHVCNIYTSPTIQRRHRLDEMLTT